MIRYYLEFFRKKNIYLNVFLEDIHKCLQVKYLWKLKKSIKKLNKNLISETNKNNHFVVDDIFLIDTLNE